MLIAAAGLEATYALDAATFLFSLVVLTMMRTPPAPADAQPPSLRTIAEGVRYAPIPDHLRGRLAGVEMISWSSGPTLGNVEAGAVAALAGVRASVVAGGVACVAGTAALALALPRFWRYDSRAAEAGVGACVPNITDAPA